MSSSGVMPFSAPGRSYRIVQAFPAGATVIAHNLGNSSIQVDLRDQATGDWIDCLVTETSSNTCTISMGVAVSLARLTIQS